MFSSKSGANPLKQTADQLVRLNEMGFTQPTESLMLRLENTPINKMITDLKVKLKNPILTTRRSNITIGGRIGYAYENTTPVGGRRISAKAYFLKWDDQNTLVLAAPTLSPSSPFDLDRDCCALLASVKAFP